MADRAHRQGSLTYDPAADLAARYPGWFLAPADLGGLVPEVLCWERRVILIEASASEQVQRCSLAHAVAHLDLGHRWTLAGFFENREEHAADRLAAQRLIPLESFVHAVAWCEDRTAIAAELGVDLAMLRVREQDLTRTERRRLRQGRRGAGHPV